MNHIPDVVLGAVKGPGNIRYLHALGRSQNDLSPPSGDDVGVCPSKHLLQAHALGHRQVPDV